jgi:hypothetical protein
MVVRSKMMSDSTRHAAPTRAADGDRIQVAQLLTEAAAQGRLPMDEYENRLTPPPPTTISTN